MGDNNNISKYDEFFKESCMNVKHQADKYLRLVRGRGHRKRWDEWEEEARKGQGMMGGK